MFGFWLRVGNSKSPRVKTFESSKKLKTQKLESKKEKRAKEDKEAGTNNNRVFWQIEKRHLPYRILFLKLMKRHFENSEIFVTKTFASNKMLGHNLVQRGKFSLKSSLRKTVCRRPRKGTRGSPDGTCSGTLSSDKSTSDNLSAISQLSSPVFTIFQESWIFKFSYSAIKTLKLSWSKILISDWS